MTQAAQRERLGPCSFGQWSSTTAAGGGTTVKAAYNADLKTTIIVTSGGLTLYEYVGDNPQQRPYPYYVNDPT